MEQVVRYSFVAFYRLLNIYDKCQLQQVVQYAQYKILMLLRNLLPGNIAYDY